MDYLWQLSKKKMNKKLAILDLGTNTFHLLIAEVTEDAYYTLYKEKISVKIGQNGISHGYITPEAEIRAIDAIIHFRSIIKSQGVTDVFAIATSAFRNAANGYRLAEKICEATGIKVKIISGDREAELIYHGVKKALQIGQETSLILDIGGGSNEFIICDERHIYWKGSFEIGAQRLVDVFHGHDPILMEDMAKLEHYLDCTLEPLAAAVEFYKPKVLIGASGAFDTLNEIYRQENAIEIFYYETEFEMPAQKFHEIHKEIISKNKEDRLKIPGMIEMRVDMIVVASCLINFIIRKHHFNRIRTSAYSLKEGVLHSILNTVRANVAVV